MSVSVCLSVCVYLCVCLSTTLSPELHVRYSPAAYSKKVIRYVFPVLFHHVRNVFKTVWLKRRIPSMAPYFIYSFIMNSCTKYNNKKQKQKDTSRHVMMCAIEY